VCWLPRMNSTSLQPFLLLQCSSRTRPLDEAFWITGWVLLEAFAKKETSHLVRDDIHGVISQCVILLDHVLTSHTILILKEDSDQPGLWYALTRAHMDHFPQYASNHSICNETLGIVETLRAYGPDMNDYFRLKVGAVFGCCGAEIAGIPKDQPIMWSKGPDKGSSPFGGLGVQFKFG
jgi:hypothetical protein